MAKKSTRVPGTPGETAVDVRLDETASVFAETRIKMQELVRGAAAMMRNQQVAAGLGNQSLYPAIDHDTLRILLMNLVGATQETCSFPSSSMPPACPLQRGSFVRALASCLARLSPVPPCRSARY